MASTYHLLCFECDCYLSFGKVYSQRADGSALGTTTFDGVYEGGGNLWHKRDAYFGQVIEAFLIQHRNHELRFVPEGVDELFETPTRAIASIDPVDLLRRQLGVGVDAEAELQDWMSRVRPAK